MKPDVSDVRYTAASPAKVEQGLLGFTSFLIDGSIRVDSVQVRLTRDGRRVLSFPSRRDHQGHEHAYLAPINDETRLTIETQVFDAIGLGEERRP